MKHKFFGKMMCFVMLCILVMCNMMKYDSGNGFHKTKISDFSSKALAGMSDETYTIKTKSQRMSVDLNNPNSIVFNLSTDSEVEIVVDNASFWTLDHVVRPGDDSMYITSSKTIHMAAGTHNLYLISSIGEDDVMVTYTIYPYCKIYYKNGTSFSRLASFPMEKEGRNFSIPLKSFDGYDFEGWFLDSDYKDSITSVNTSVGKDYYIYPKLKAKVYTIKYNLDGGNLLGDYPTYYTVEDAYLTLPIPQKEEYDFLGWYTNPSYTKLVTTINPSDCKNISLYAKWGVHQYNISYVGAGKGKNPSTYTKLQSNIVLQDPEPKENYNFIGWYQDEKCTVPISQIDTSKGEDVSIYALWKKCRYSIKYELDGGINNKYNPTSFLLNEQSIVLKNPTKSGYVFGGWYTDSDKKNLIKKIDTTKEQDITIYALWKKGDYSIKYELDGGINDISNPTYYVLNSYSITLKNPTKSGYDFGGWYTDSAKKNLIKEINTTKGEDLTLYALWKPIQYKITYELDGGKNSIANPITYTVENSDIYLSEPIKEGYVFKGWFEDKDFKKLINKVETKGRKNITLYAKWEDAFKKYSIETKTQRLTTDYINTPKITFNLSVDSDVEISVDTSSFWSLDYIAQSGAANIYITSSKTIHMMSGKHNLYMLDALGGGDYSVNATYTIYPYCTIYYKNGESFSALTSFPMTKKKQSLDIPLKNFDGYDFDGWFSDSDCKNPITNVDTSAGKDYYVYPKLKAKVYTIKYNLDGGKNNSKNPNTYKVEDGNIKLEAPTKEGYVFKGWYWDSIYFNKVDEITPSICKELTLYAKWDKDTQNIENNSESSGDQEKIHDDNQPNDKNFKVTMLKKGTIFSVYNKNIKAMVLNSGKMEFGKIVGAKVKYLKPISKDEVEHIVDKVKYKGVNYTITEISPAFKYNWKIRRIILPKNISKIPANMFLDCKNLHSIKFTSKTITQIGKNAIKGIDKKCIIKVPSGRVKVYKKKFTSKTGYKNSMCIK